MFNFSILDFPRTENQIAAIETFTHYIAGWKDCGHVDALIRKLSKAACSDDNFLAGVSSAWRGLAGRYCFNKGKC